MKSLKVYYVDDDMDDIHIFSDIVSRIKKNIEFPIDLEVFSHGTELLGSLEKLDPIDPIIFFLDINMTGLSGFDVLKSLRNNPDWEKAPVIIYSTSSDPNTIHTAFLLDATGYMIKPNDSLELRKVLTKIFMIDWPTYERAQASFIMNF